MKPRKILSHALVGAFAAILLVSEPLATPSRSAHTVSAWDIEYDDNTYWCEGCCTSNVWYACCLLDPECKHPIQMT